MVSKCNTHNVSQSSQAEKALTSTKAGREKNVSLLDATYCDIVESSRFEAKWQIEWMMSNPLVVGQHHSFLTKEMNSEKLPEQSSF